MKRIMRKNRIIVLAFFTVFSVSSSRAMAEGSNKGLSVELKYSGDIHNQPHYKLVVLGNTGLDQFTVIIRDAFNNLLFSENIKAENFTKSFVLNTDEIGNDTICFEIVNKATKQSLTYEINRYSHLENATAQ